MFPANHVGTSRRLGSFALCVFVFAILSWNAHGQMQIIGIQEDECKLSPNLYQQRPTFFVCMAENAPFLVKRELYSPGGDVGCPDQKLQHAPENTFQYRERYEEIEAEMSKNPQSGQLLGATEFHELYSGYDSDLLLAVMSSGVFRKHGYKVRLLPSTSAAMYGVRTGICDFALSGFVHVGSVLNEELCDEGEIINGTAFLQFQGTCPMPENGAVPTLEHICCLEYTQWYKRWGPAVLSLQLPKQTQSELFFQNIAKPDVIRVLCAVILALLVSGHLVWFVERQSNSLQFPEEYGIGVDHGLWWSVVTMTTVGYGDKAPVTFLGRLLGVAWMFSGVILLGYLNGLMLEGYVNPPARYIKIETWLDIRSQAKDGTRFCTSSDTFFNSTLAGQSITPSAANPTAASGVIFEDNLETCYQLLLEDKIAGVIENKPRLMFDAVNSNSNFLTPLGMCHDLVISPVIEPFYHSVVVGKPSTDPSDFHKNLKCSLDQALEAFEDGRALFSRPDHPSGPSYASQDAHIDWFREYKGDETNLITARDENTADMLSAYVLLCGTLLAYAVMFTALWIARYRQSRMVADRQVEQEELVPKSALSHYDSPVKSTALSDAAEPKPTDVHFAASLNEDRLVTVCEQLSDLRLMVKRLENLQAGIQMPNEKSKSYAKRKPKTSPAETKTPRHDNFSSPFTMGP
mmetsp:Transcript_36366/g.102735  ORF Transcript_36366/g.102735 Transcript_36366/m.102735 type:complete len:688 (-) Transcript_36366:194-2257(-)|eukprot:CAMPEP_0117647780 /NCGR_PEP_ID=MMETSP0804-20121206/29_1 /TAXON_ID=1074897 /ORGANISM="Tetraselmis astigmatica, Strain CCMP880" /LENGTH=687 /DNA_ID=CAMNT_0005453289 /DNA_START=358 /DNA_END=2421 /DNA_ORIENTATION=-